MTEATTSGPGSGNGFGTSLPSYAAPPTRGRGVAFVGIAVAVVLALAAGAFAVATMAAAGGAPSPEAAVEDLFEALADEDVLGVLDTLAPAERELYLPFIEDLVVELQRLEVLSGDLELGDIPGFELEVDGLEVESSELGDGVALVSVTGGSITGMADPAAMPLGPFLRELADESGFSDAEPTTETDAIAADGPVEIMAIDDDGWHVSLHYSIAEQARKAAGADLPDFGNGVEPEGGETPEAALQELVQAAVDLDARRLVSLMPPGEMSALHDYAPLFLDEAEEAVTALRSDVSYDISIDQLDTSTDRDGNRATVTISGFEASGEIADVGFDLGFDGTCLRGSADGEDVELCPEEEGIEGPSSDFASDLLDAGLGVELVERDGAWYVSPTRSMFEVTLAVVRAVDRADLEDPERFLEDIVGQDLAPFLGGADDELFDADEGFDDEGGDPFTDCDAIYDDLPSDATDEEYAEADEAWFDCYDAALEG